MIVATTAKEDEEATRATLATMVETMVETMVAIILVVKAKTEVRDDTPMTRISPVS